MKLNKMVLDKKIEEAKDEIYEDRFLLNGEEVVFDNDAKEEMFYEGDIKEAIGLGAKWMQEELLKDLWHPASEMPDKNRICLVRVVYHLNCGMLPDEERIEQSSFHDFGWYDYDLNILDLIMILLAGSMLMIYFQRKETNND